MIQWADRIYGNHVYLFEKVDHIFILPPTNHIVQPNPTHSSWLLAVDIVCMRGEVIVIYEQQ